MSYGLSISGFTKGCESPGQGRADHDLCYLRPQNGMYYCAPYRRKQYSRAGMSLRGYRGWSRPNKMWCMIRFPGIEDFYLMWSLPMCGEKWVSSTVVSDRPRSMYQPEIPQASPSVFRHPDSVPCQLKPNGTKVLGKWRRNRGFRL